MRDSGESRHEYLAHRLPRRARRVMPSGNTRSTIFVPPTPPYAVRGEGCWLEDQLGHRVIDCNNNYTSLIHGHSHSGTLAAVADRAALGTAFGLPTEHEIDLAELLSSRTGLPRWRFSNSGTEAVMTAVRAARAYTNRDLIVRFGGSYHGTYDGVADASSRGVPDAVSAQSLILPQGDYASFDRAMADVGGRVAAVLMDLMPNRAGLVPVAQAFVDHVRAVTTDHRALLVIDEVITFRLREGGLHTAYGVHPDLVTVGKVIGGGFPVGAVGGTVDVMSVFDPRGSAPLVWGGTFSANPISMVAGATALLEFPLDRIAELNASGDRLRQELSSAGFRVSGAGSLLRIRERVDPALLWWDLYERGVLVGTNGLLSLSTAMSPSDLDHVADVVADALQHARTRPALDVPGQDVGSGEPG